MTCVAWFQCFSGIAGDMALGATVDAGADLDDIRGLCRRMPVTGWDLDAEPVLRGGIAATKVHVRVTETAVVRTLTHIHAIIDEARLPDRVRQRAQATFTALAEAEGRLHGRPPARVHFHEVGGLDALLDIVGTCAGLELLGVDEVWASPVANGMGVIRSAHGLLPNPSPAVVELLRGAPTYAVDLPVELTTPTGASLLAALTSGWGPLPAVTVEATGFGAGTRDLDRRPNVVQLVVGGRAAVEAQPGQPLTLVEVNVDDATGETLAYAVAALLDAGAHDAWITPIIMKKGRPAHTVSALADPALVAQVVATMARETGSLGVRATQLERWTEPRQMTEVEVHGYPMRVKVSPGRVKVEHDDAARVARLTGRPLHEVVMLGEAAARQSGARPEPPDGTAS